MIRRLLRLARIALFAALGLVLLALVAAWAVLGTTPGSEWVLDQGARLAGVETRFGAITGSFLGRLELEDLSVDTGKEQVALGRLVLDWRPRALLHRHLDVRELLLHELTLVLPETPPPPGEPRVVVPELPQVTLPLTVTVAHFELTALRLGAADTPPVVDRVAGAISGADDSLTLKSVTIERAGLSASLDAGLELSGDWPLKLTAALSGREADMDLALRATLDGSVRQPVLAATVTAPFNVDASVDADLRTHPPAAKVDLAWREVALPGSPVRSPAGSLKASTRDRGLELELRADVDGAPGDVTRVVLTGTGALETFDAPYAFSSAFDWKLAAAGQDFAGKAKASGDRSRITLDHTLETPFHVTTRGTVTPDGPATRVDLGGEWRGVAWPPGATDAPGSPEGRYSVTGDVSAFIAEVDAALAGVSGVSAAWTRIEGGAAIEAPHPFTATLQWKAETEQAGSVKGSGTLSGDADAIRFDHEVTGPATLNAAGSVTLSPAISVDVSGTLALPRWPLEGDAVASAVDARFAVRGPVDALVTRVDGTVETAAAGPLSLGVGATVTPERAQGLDLTLGVLEGSVTAKGQVGWSKALEAALEIQARGINPRRLHPNAAGALDARLTTDLRLTDGKPAGPVILHRLGGTLGGYPVSGEGRVEILGDGFEARGIALSSGANTLALDGRMTDTVDATVTLAAPDLKQLWPGLEGSVKGSGTVSGSAQAPILKGNFTASGVRAGGIRVRNATLEVDAGLTEDARLSAKLRASDLSADGTDVSALSLDLDGTTGNHRLTLTADTSHGRFKTAARGGLVEQTWAGQVDELDARGTALGDWAQTAAWKLRVNAAGAESDQACLASDGARLCLQATRPASDAQTVEVTLAALPVARFSAWLPAGLAITGDLEAAASASRRGAGAWEALATVTPTPIRIRLDEVTAGAPLELNLTETRLEARHGKDGSVAEIKSRIGDKGRLDGRVTAGPMTGNDPALGGRIEATLPDLTPFRALVPALSDLAGRLEAGLNLSGTIGKPRIEGAASLEDASAGIAAAGITVKDIKLQVNADAGGTLRVDGRARSGEGTLAVTGEGRTDDGKWSARLQVKGDNFEAVKLIRVQALVSPDIEVVANPDLVQVRGVLHVPEASVNIQELPPDVVQVSSDEIIVGSRQPEASAMRQQLDVKVDITLGPKVQISAFGLDTGLEGGLAIAVAGASPPTGRGTVSLRDGRFKAYGQDLKVRRGRLLFAGPLDNPGLDVRAVRENDQVLAGIEVSGTAANMSSRVFSEPPLPQAEALAWLLTGRGLSGASQSDGATLAGAALALGLEQGDQVSRQIGSTLGLDELSVASGDTLEESSLVLGKALSPRLFIRYALGVLGGPGSVMLNYKVTDKVSVEAETSEDSQGADVLYRLER